MRGFGFSRFGGDDEEGQGMTNPVFEDYGAGGGVSNFYITGCLN